jgi:hypothetical protein
MNRGTARTTAGRAAMADQTVGELAELYLGNILYALELAAVGLDAQGRREDAAFYRGIARKLADAHGKGSGYPPEAGGAGRGSRATGDPPEALSGGAY